MGWGGVGHVNVRVNLLSMPELVWSRNCVSPRPRRNTHLSRKPTKFRRLNFRVFVIAELCFPLGETIIFWKKLYFTTSLSGPPGCLCMHVYACMSMHACLCMHVYVCLCMSMYVCLCMCVYVCLCMLSMSMSMYVYVYVYVCLCLCLCMSMSMYVYVCLCMSMYVYVYMPMYVYVCTPYIQHLL